MTFEARFPGRCEACDEPIEPGQPVVFDDDDVLVHDDCRGMVRVPERAPDPCGECFLVHAGECS